MVFQPVDHKDSSPEYRAVVWATVPKQVGESIEGVNDVRQILGLWEFKNYQVSFGEQGIATFTYPDGTIERELYSVAPSRLQYVDRHFHLALTQSGKLLIFNGDGSARMIGDRRALERTEYERTE